MFPYECRNRSLTYSAPIYATIARKFDNEPEAKVTLCLGEIPVMVRSKFCNLHELSEEELIRRREDCFEFGGYFIINGNERLIRMLVQTKRNFPIAFQRPTFVSRGRLFSSYAV
jgi:DNA-directed RNA polymerase I subunit RPA2